MNSSLNLNFLILESEKYSFLYSKKNYLALFVFVFAIGLGPSIWFLNNSGQAPNIVASAQEYFPLPLTAQLAPPKEVGIPKILSIPSLNIKASIQPVGENIKEEMNIPNQYYDTAWFSRGPRPGQIGSAVITGHVDTIQDMFGIFYNLNKLKTDEYVYIEDEQGEKYRFKVISSQRYAAVNAPLDKIFGNTQGIFLNLITCAGKWNEKTKEYPERLVVFTQYSP